ncbi:MAG TPA: insulinase family protein, partial [Nitrospirota bacterium]
MKRIPMIMMLVLFLTIPAAAQEAPPVTASAAGSQSSIKGPVGDRYLLSNGMVLLVKENHTLPIVTMSMVIKAGSIVEPEDKAGLAGLTAGLLMKGAAGM